ncbi:hypothetical protein MBAV_000257 [Candidatus Magnetobacterium bavaricum]|uniref:Uncharacterized protein n=1 Tax=Candidatus Magnetobacterium bavaricum TaxID=29290 RepID=A0A0F3H0D0_9BACT|nr:hypothetical protein MBAV_000257 [Candidatus Magnetobacterium bavaricum]
MAVEENTCEHVYQMPATNLYSDLDDIATIVVIHYVGSKQKNFANHDVNLFITDIPVYGSITVSAPDEKAIRFTAYNEGVETFFYETSISAP